MHEWPELKGGPDPINWSRVVWTALATATLIGFIAGLYYFANKPSEPKHYPQIEHAKPIYEKQQFVQSALTGEKMQVITSTCYLNECSYQVRVRSKEGFDIIDMQEFEIAPLRNEAGN